MDWHISFMDSCQDLTIFFAEVCLGQDFSSHIHGWLYRRHGPFGLFCPGHGDDIPAPGSPLMPPALCTHCLGEILPGGAVYEDDGEERLSFCCPACQGIYHLIRDEGLGSFYREREGWQPGRPETAKASPAAFQVRTRGDEAEADILLSGLRCTSCVWLIERYLARIPGLLSVRVNHATHRTKVQWDSRRTGLATILDRIAALGYRAAPSITGARDELLEQERKDLLIRMAIAVFLTLQIMFFSIALYDGYFRTIDPWAQNVMTIALWLLATPVIFFAGYPFISNALRGLRAGAVTMDTLIFLGSMSAYLYSVFALFHAEEVYFDTAAMIITLILLGRFLEAGARQKASGAISALMALQPAEARAVRQGEGGQEETTLEPVVSLSPGDRIAVIPGDAIPFDCEVLAGESEVDESMLTGESVPVMKRAGAKVYSGTVNLNGRLILQISKGGEDTLLAGVIKEVEEAQNRKARVERVADRVTVWFVPFILAAAAMTFVLWYRTGVGTAASLMNAVSVLVISCPCALGLATPMAILTGTSRATREGLLVRGGDVLEVLSGIDTVVFDKTGTLTEGRQNLVEVVGYGAKRDDVLTIAASLEQHSEHTIATAFRQAAGKGVFPVLHFRTSAGKGVAGLINGQQAVLGSDRFLREQGVPIAAGQQEGFAELSATGGTVVGLALGNRLRGWLSVRDSLRPEARGVVTRLKQAGYTVILLTGDGRNAAASMAGDLGIAEKDTFAGATPMDKAGIVRGLRSGGKRVLMVGDGINDAPALTEADAGAAMGRGTNIAIQSADAVLMRNDLGLTIRLLEISRETLTTIRQNLFWAFSYNAIAIPLAAAGKIHPGISAALMAASSLLVVGNSLRLRKGRQQKDFALCPLPAEISPSPL